jgi:hypothetical protein
MNVKKKQMNFLTISMVVTLDLRGDKKSQVDQMFILILNVL